MKLRAFSVHGKDTLFGLEDCPVHVSKSLVALVNKRYSEMLQAETIVRTDERLALTEGDIIYDKSTGELLGYVIYSSGFKVQTTQGFVKDVPDKEHIYVRHRNTDSVKEVVESCMRTPLLFKYGEDTVLKLKSVVKANGDKHIGILQKKSTGAYSVRACELKWFSGLRDEDGNKFFYGDKLGEQVLVYRNGLPVWVTCKEVSKK